MKLEETEKIIGFKAQNKKGKPGQYGFSEYGFFEYGASTPYSGIYSQRKIKGKVLTLVKKFYIPTNPQTELQQANRQKLAAGVLAWQELSEEQKNEYRTKAKNLPLTGFNLFIREYMLS